MISCYVITFTSGVATTATTTAAAAAAAAAAVIWVDVIGHRHRDYRRCMLNR